MPATKYSTPILLYTHYQMISEHIWCRLAYDYCELVPKSSSQC